MPWSSRAAHAHRSTVPGIAAGAAGSTRRKRRSANSAKPMRRAAGSRHIGSGEPAAAGEGRSLVIGSPMVAPDAGRPANAAHAR